MAGRGTDIKLTSGVPEAGRVVRAGHGAARGAAY